MISNYKKLVLIIVTILLVQIVIPLYATHANEENNEYLSTIEEIITWKKSSIEISENEPILTQPFLKNAGDTTGDWFPVGLGRIGYPDDYDAYLAVIENEVSERYKEKDLLSESKATEWHRISLAILAMGGDPTKIGKDADGNPINLIEDGTYNREKENSIGAQGINGWIWGLITLDSMRYKVPNDALTNRQDIIVKIVQKQLNDGGFSLSEEAADPDMTGMAITALAPYYNSEETFTYVRESSGKEVKRTVREVIDEALETLSSIQLDSGGFSTMDMENTESIVQVIVALTSVGVDIFSDERFIKNGQTIYDALMTFQMNDGGYAHSKVYDEDNPTAKPGESNAMATDQALYALVSLYRYDDHRTLYDFRPELPEDIKGKITLVEKEIEALESNKEQVIDVFTLYKNIPLEERSYVRNYSILADEMNQLNIENDTEPISEKVGMNTDGKGTITSLFNKSITEDGEVTDEDLAKVDDLIGVESTEYAVEVVTLLNKLASFNTSYEEEIALLENEKDAIDTLQLEIDDLNETIVAELFPFEKISLRDRDKVKQIMERYEILSAFDQEKVINYEDVEKAEAQIDSMKRNIMIAMILGVILVLGVGMLIYRRKKRKHKKKASSYLND